MPRDLQKRQLKRHLRRSIKQSILAMDPDARASQEVTLAARFPGLPGYAAAQSVLLYAHVFLEEINTRPFFLHALAARKRVLCPRIDPSRNCLRLFEIIALARDLEPGFLGIPEPRKDCREVAVEEVDWALIPGIAFDPHCYRLGRGAGYYDRLLPGMRSDALRWALAYDCQITPRVPIEPHDVPIDGVAAPRQVFYRTQALGSFTAP